MNRRTIFMNNPIWAPWVIGLLFEFPFKQWYLTSITKLIDRRSCVLMSGQNCVQLVEQTFRQFSILRNTVDDELDRCFLISKNVNESRRLDVGDRVRNQI